MAFGWSDVLKSRVFDLHSWTLGVGSRIPHGARSLYLITCRYHAFVCCKINARPTFFDDFSHYPSLGRALDDGDLLCKNHRQNGAVLRKSILIKLDC